MSGSGIRQTRFRAGEGATHLLLVRHGESAAVDAGSRWPTVDGHGNPPLHPHGRAQAERVADRLAGEGLSAIYVTPFDRTRDTAAPLLGRLGLQAGEEWDLREVHLGEWESPVTRRYFAEGHPMARRINEEERWDIPPGAESHEAFGRRVTDAVRRIAGRHRGQVVAVFSHGGVIGRILAEATGSRPFAFTVPDNASISHLVVSGERWTVRRFNDIGHLSERFVDVPDLPWADGSDQAVGESVRRTG
ncbi:MAG TPA: histidine phosphatase family protein [Acidimicrobiales bacterium]|nr:histidine phosphatase family protein [Acidimicrobiales bacterium]